MSLKHFARKLNQASRGSRIRDISQHSTRGVATVEIVAGVTVVAEVEGEEADASTQLASWHIMDWELGAS